IYRPHPLVQGKLKPREILIAAVVIYILAIGVAVYLSIVRGWIVAALSLVGCLISYFYTADPVNFKGRALGEVVMFFGSGPVMVTGAFFVQTASLTHSGPVLLISVSIGMWWSLVLVANNMKDIETDRETSGRTIAMLLGRGRTITLYSIMVALIYGLTAAEIVMGMIPLWGIAIFLSLIPLVRLIVSFRKADTIPADADPRTAKVEVLFTVLFIFAFGMHFLLPTLATAQA
ncbi:MAG TPA: prenyltransferase, partial [Spirochaetia bacterium]|nr:prenyltransferase [Spirochaetia bacterium]